MADDLLVSSRYERLLHFVTSHSMSYYGNVGIGSLAVNGTFVVSQF
jgi:hypothetical protein